MNPPDNNSLRKKNRRLLAILLSIITGLVIVSVVLVAFVFPRRHGRIPRNAREAVLGIPQPPVDSTPTVPASSPGTAPNSAPASAPVPAPPEPVR